MQKLISKAKQLEVLLLRLLLAPPSWRNIWGSLQRDGGRWRRLLQLLRLLLPPLRREFDHCQHLCVLCLKHFYLRSLRRSWNDQYH